MKTLVELETIATPYGNRTSPPIAAEPRKVRRGWREREQLRSWKRADVDATNYSNQLEEEKALL